LKAIDPGERRGGSRDGGKGTLLRKIKHQSLLGSRSEKIEVFLSKPDTFKESHRKDCDGDGFSRENGRKQTGSEDGVYTLLYPLEKIKKWMGEEKREEK